MGFRSVRTRVDAEDDGQYQLSSWRKVPSQATTVGAWADLSMAAGNPPPNYYATSPLVAATLDGNRGIYHGQSIVGMTKHLSQLLALTVTSTAVPLTLYLLDYLLYYPFIDMDDTETQYLDNTVTLPRYADGKGVRAFLVAVYPYIGGQNFFITYTNQNGVSGRISPLCTANTVTTIATLVTGANLAGSIGPFIPLQAGDTGVRSVEGIRFLGAVGGLASLVLCKPLATTMLREITAPVERDYLTDIPSLPRVLDGAYLNFLALPAGTLAAAPIFGMAKFVWG